MSNKGTDAATDRTLNDAISMRATDTTSHPAGERMLKLAEVGERMGLRERALTGLLSAGKFGPTIIRFNRRVVRVRESEFNSWVQAGCPPRAEWLQQRPEWTNEKVER